MIRSRVFFQSMCGCVQCLSDRYEIVWRIYSQMRGWQTFRNVRRGSCGQRIISISGRLPLRITKTLHVRRVYTRSSDDRAIANSFFILFFLPAMIVDDYYITFARAICFAASDPWSIIYTMNYEIHAHIS